MQMNKDTKQAIVIRKDLKMRRGKEIAQGSHASVAFLTRKMDIEYDTIRNKHTGETVLTQAEIDWLKSSFKKICLKVNSEEELLAIDKAAKDAGLVCHLVQDSGKTEFGGVPTYTCLAIGPDYSENIDLITKDLELY